MEDAEVLQGSENAYDVSRWQNGATLLLARLEASGYSGWDPFDALNSRLFNATPLAASRYARLAWTQACKRSPINLRRLALVRPTANVVTLALAAEVHRRRHDTGKAQALVDAILRSQSDFGGGALSAWGYPFAWQAKAFYVPNGAANIIATAYCVRELVQWVEAIPQSADAIAAAARFTAERLMRESGSGSRYIAYVENSDAMVHNASLWGAYVLAAGARLTGRSGWLELASAAIRHSLKGQRQDGSWPYGEASHHGFTDGFHTGYVLEALQRIEALAPGTVDRDKIKQGFNYYLSNLFEVDGTAKYYADSRYPLDVNCAAQAIITIDALGLRDECQELCERISDSAVRNLWLADEQRFAYQRGKKFLNRINYPRWTQIWMALAFQIMAGTPLSSAAPTERHRRASAASVEAA